MSRGPLVALLILVLLTGAGCATAAPAVPVPSPLPSTVEGAASRVLPTRVRIPAIGVDTALVDLGVDGAGVLVPPERADVAGWFTAGPAPGEPGPALVAGHVDSRAGPGAFHRLRDLAPGDEIVVARSDGSAVTFTVTSRAQTPKAAFPTQLVYAPTPGPELRLVTCGGTFDRAVRSYRDNIVVEAVSADPGRWTVE